MHPTPAPPNLIIGLGNELRGDDAAGLLAARRLRAKAIPNLAVREWQGEGSGLISLWENLRTVILVDAVLSGARTAGFIHHFDATNQPLPAPIFAASSTHSFGLAEAVELARALGRLPQRLIVYGIEGRQFATGASPTPEVEAAIAAVVESILEELVD